jgi:hypothetical protein
MLDENRRRLPPLAFGNTNELFFYPPLEGEGRREAAGWGEATQRNVSTPPRLIFRYAPYEPTLPLQGRVRKSAATFRFHHRRLGIPDRPLEPVIGLAGGETRWRAMTVESAARRYSSHTPTFPRRDTPELCKSFRPEMEGAGNAGCRLHPQPRAQ